MKKYGNKLVDNNYIPYNYISDKNLTIIILKVWKNMLLF